MKVLIFGATGMVGRAALAAALTDPRVTHVRAVVRRPPDYTHPRLDVLVLEDFFDYTAVEANLTGFDACLFCLGVTAAGKDEATYRRLTYDLTLAAAETLARRNPAMTFCYVSGSGTDAGSRVMWARVKGETEAALSRLPFRAVYHFRPGFIRPEGDARPRIPLYRLAYAVTAPLYPVLRRLFPDHVTTAGEVGRALVEAGLAGAPAPILESRAIRALAARAPR